MSCPNRNTAQPSTSEENFVVLICTGTPEKPLDNKTSPSKGNLTPEDVWPFPKAAARTKAKGRKKGKSAVLTETPEKDRVEQETLKRMEKNQKQA